jgi:hypothetical protein
VPKLQLSCRINRANIPDQGHGHWHYANYYYARCGSARVAANREPSSPIYTPATNLTIMQLENAALPIYQR